MLEEMILTGTFFRNVDNKGRFIVPASFKPTKGEELICVDREKYIAVESKKKYISKITKLTEEAREKETFKILNSTKVDAQGRINLNTTKLKELTKKTVVIVGCFDHFRIYKKENFEKEKANVLVK